jgi:hypothetical protein
MVVDAPHSRCTEVARSCGNRAGPDQDLSRGSAFDVDGHTRKPPEWFWVASWVLRHWDDRNQAGQPWGIGLCRSPDTNHFPTGVRVRLCLYAGFLLLWVVGEFSPSCQ